MKRVSNVLICFLTLTLLSICAQGQTRELQLKKLKQYWLDKHDQPWSDLSYQMAVRLDPLYARDVGSDEISIQDPAVKYTTGEWRFYSLQRDGKGTFAEVDYLVYRDSQEPVGYEIELRKGNKAVPFSKGSREVKVSNDSVPGSIRLQNANSIFLRDWLFIGGLVLIGMILVYILVFRWLFSGLLFKRRWAVPTAEHFTLSASLLVMLGLASALTLLYLGPRLETWITIGVVGAFWLLHGLVWLVSGKQA